MANTQTIGALSVEQERRVDRVAHRVLEILRGHGIERVFGIPGGTISPLYDALEDVGIDVVVCQHEGMAAYLAYGHSRGTGQPGVVLVTSGPGILNAITGIAAAYQDEVPMLVLAGEVQSNNAPRGALQNGGADGLDLVTMLRPITKFIDTIQQPHRATVIMEQGLRAAMEHPRGPAFIRLPMDVTTGSVPSMRLGQALRPPAAVDRELIRDVGTRLAGARRPAILLGIGARVAGVSARILEIAERLRCPVMTDIEAKGVFPERHSLSLGLFGVGGLGAAARYLDEGVDVLVTVGARLDDTTTNGFSGLLRGDDAHVVQIDHNPWRLARAYRPDTVLEGDLDDTLTALRDALPRPDVRLLLGREALVVAARASVEPEVVEPMGRGPHDPRAVVRALQEVFGPDTVFTTDIGNHHVFAARELVIDEPDAFHISNGLGGMGSGIGSAMGLAMALGERRRVVGICGDGSALMVGNELATCSRYGIPVVLAVFNDGVLGMVDHGMEKIYGRTAGYVRAPADLVGFARSLGASAMRIESRGDLEVAAVRAGRGPLLLDIPIDPSVRTVNPREDVLNFPKEA